MELIMDFICYYGTWLLTGYIIGIISGTILGFAICRYKEYVDNATKDKNKPITYKSRLYRE